MTIENAFGPHDDALHRPGDSHYETETFWYSFFVPERTIGGWMYASVRQNAGVTAGGMWMWDDSAAHPIDSPFYEYFAHLKLPADRGPDLITFPTGMRVEVREPLMVYDISYDDRARMDARLRFEAVEPPVPLRTGEPPYPKAHHFDQTGRVTGTVTLDGDPIAVDCFAMRDRSWGPRTERGYHRVGYTWAAGPTLSLLTYTAPVDEGAEHIYSGYLRRGDRLSRIVNGVRHVERDPVQRWVSAISLDVETEDGDRTSGRATAVSRLLLSIGITSACAPCWIGTLTTSGWRAKTKTCGRSRNGDFSAPPAGTRGSRSGRCAGRGPARIRRGLRRTRSPRCLRPPCGAARPGSRAERSRPYRVTGCAP